MKQNGGIQTKMGGLIQVDMRPGLRCAPKANAMVTLKQFVGDRGFGDCPMLIKYCFRTSHNQSVLGEYQSTESSFYDLQVGDTIVVRYDIDSPHFNAPEDSLSIVRKIVPGVDWDSESDNNGMDTKGSIDRS